MGDYAKCKWCGTEFRKGAMKRFVSNNTMGIAGREKYCSKRCKLEAEAANGGGGGGNIISGNVQGGGGGGGTVVVNKESGMAAAFKTMGSMGKTDTEELEMEHQIEKEKQEALEGKIEDVASIEISSDSNEIQNQLNRLLAIAASRPERKVRKAIIEKLEFGIMKLKSTGAGPEVEYFEGKLATFRKRGRL